MSVASVQTVRILEEIARLLYASGEKPNLSEIINDVSAYFSAYPVGEALPMPDTPNAGTRSNVDQMNQIIAHAAQNLDVLYEATNDQVVQIMMLTTILRTHLDRLKARREVLTSKVDDYLFSLYNTDGYYFSISDTFNDLSLVDLNLTSAFVDVSGGNVLIPTISSLTRKLPSESITLMSTTATFNGSNVSYRTVSDFSGAVDGLSNTLWDIEVTTSEPGEVVLETTIGLGSTAKPTQISRIEFDPFGITPLQLFIETRAIPSGTQQSIFTDFGGQIKTSAHNMVFVDTPREIDRVKLTMRKVTPDYVEQRGSTTSYRYIFAAKNISFTEHVYDNSAQLISEPLSMPPELATESIIDAVSLVAEATIPNDTSLTYYVAANVLGETPDIEQFEWKRIEPIDSIKKSPNTIVKFDGALSFVKMIRANPAENELQLIPTDETNSDLAQRNPSSVIIPGVDIYRIAEIDPDVLLTSIFMEEGVNSTRVLYTTFNPDHYANGLAFWTDYINGTKVASQIYGQIDTGNEFFYGGDIGEGGKSVYVETYVEVDANHPLVLKTCRKADANSRQWDLKVFLNGRQVAAMPVGVNEVLIPWQFDEGLNHISVIIDIPFATEAYPNSYLGTLDLMGSANLNDFGTVKLATWNYVDIFKMRYNEVDAPFTFTIYNNEIISRRKPTTNFRVKYAKVSDSAPQAVRLRVDFDRSTLNQHVSPSLNSYRLRFLYGN